MINSQSTPQEVLAAYIDNSNYDLAGSIEQAKLFIHACRVLQVMRPESISSAGVSQKYTTANIQNDLKRAEAWLAAKTRSGLGRVYRADISRSRWR